MKKVLIAVASPLPLISAFFAKALAETYALAEKENIELSFIWFPDETTYKNEATEVLLTENKDTLVFIKPHIQWVATDLISLIKSEHLVEGAASRNYYAEKAHYKVIVNEPKPDQDVTAKFLELDFVKIEKEVFHRIKEFVIHINFTDKDIIEQIPAYWYNSTDESGIKNEDVNFCLALEKAEIPIVVNVDLAIWEHLWSPQKSFFGAEIKRDFVDKGFKSIEENI